ncbi:hypothetical protein BT96DRAFT_459037 [Gymnopus androsaceus JB14]|uniref:Uncharacterized protein n=1 Tax=Gymnopus androsaceus JB14 TaxID=1447944 RepID=A0A6A4IL36_9AGAR|nr:hypothetical protein BT96DRAFT_459037 [Gymnopus androsaceus JB14]
MAESRASLNGSVASLQSLRLSVELHDFPNTDWVLDSESLLTMQRLRGYGMKVPPINIRRSTFDPKSLACLFGFAPFTIETFF